MIAHEMKRNGRTLFLHFYAKKSCIRKSFLFYPGERRRIYLSEEILQTTCPMELILWQDGQAWILNGSRIYEERFSFLKTKAEEDIMVVLSAGSKQLAPCGRLALSSETDIRIGSAFQNEIFYDCFSFVKDIHIHIYKGQEGFLLENCSNDQYGREAAVYVNGKAVNKRMALVSGDVIEVLGLTLIYLSGLLACTSFYGTLRTVQRREIFPAFLLKGAKELPDLSVEIRQAVIEEKQLFSEELELELPESRKAQGSRPLFLTLGPSVTMVIPMLLMAVMGSAMLGENGTNYYKISVVMTAASAFLSVFWGIIDHIYKKKVSQKEEMKRKVSYQEYLSRTRQYLSECFLHNREALLAKYPACESFLQYPVGKGQLFWNRSIRQRDYLFIRLGLGEIPFQMKIKLSGNYGKINRDPLVEEARSLMGQYCTLTRVPVGIDLRKQRIAGFTGELVYPVFLQALIQLAACHNGRDMKLVYLYHEDEQKEKRIADCIKWLPHIWKNGKKLRYLAGNEKEAGELLPELVKELHDRQEEEKNLQQVFVIILAAKELVRGEGLYRILMGAKENDGIYTIFLNRKKEEIPGECECLVIKEKDREEIVCYEQEGIERHKVKFEESTFSSAESFMRSLTSLFARNQEQEKGLPEKVSFLNLYSCKKAEELNCPGRWRENQTKERIRVPIGMAAGGRLIYLDVHEKFHGPHGLIAGTTGSGKSELLQTYLLSLVIAFSPEDINFFIIDYKGGGMGNALCRLPHCAGVISNLSGRQIRRALASIKSENLRRQKAFSGAGVGNITDYTELYKEGKVQEPVPHLLLVVDEFAELKREEPEFMQEIISVAQVGRSLGIHLILSTQKPAGTVDDKIWSNTRFRLCLRVAEKQDSMDMLHRPEAAYLTGAGQCYLQVGNNELYELFQAGYGGAEYDENGTVSEESTYMISNTGKRFTCGGKEKQRHFTQLEAVTNYVNVTAKMLSCRLAKPLWMPELPDKISLKEILDRNKEEPGELSLCIGICDDPESQQQYPLYYSPVQEGNLGLFGAPAVGKSTFLQTLLFQLCQYPAGQVQFMLAASDNAGLNCFEGMANCLGIMKKREDAECFFYHVERLLAKRKEELSGISFLQYRKHKKNAGSFRFLIIDDYGSFRQMTEDRYEDLIERVAGEGLNYGFFLIVTSLNVSSAEIPGKLFDKLKVTVSLEMSDRFQYGDVLRQYHINVLPKENVKGRGLCKRDGRILEFQVPLLSVKEDDYGRIDEILVLTEKSNMKLKPEEIPEKFPYIPEKPELHTVLEIFYRKKGNRGSIPIGYEQRSGYIAGLPVRKNTSFLISGADGSGKGDLLCCMVLGLWENGIHTVLFDRKGSAAKKIKEAAFNTDNEKLLLQLQNEEEFLAWYWKSKNAGKEETCRTGFLCIADLMDFSTMLNGKNEKMWDIGEKTAQISEEEGMLPVIALCKPGREMEAAGTPVFDYIMKQQWGIHLGGNVANQRILAFDDLTYTQMNQWEKPGVGYLKKGNGSRTEKICLPYYERKDMDDTFGCAGAISE